MDVPIIIAIIAAVSAVTAALVSAAAQRSVRRLEQRFAGSARTIAFRTEQLTKLYLPVSMHLRATRALANTHYEADNPTNQEVEHALHEHNKAIVESLLGASMYVEPNVPEAATIGLLEHLLQWETVYKLKYQDKRPYRHPIWEEIRRLGYSRFPDGAAEHFHITASELRAGLHAQLSTAP